MKKIMMMAVLMAANVVYGQWLPVSVNTNTGVFKPIDIGASAAAGLTNAYNTSGTVDRAYVSGKSVVVQFNTNNASPLALTNLVALSGTNNTAFTSNNVGYVVFSTNGNTFTNPPWYRPETNYNGSLLWYSFDTENPAYVVDVTSNGNNGTSVAPVGSTVFTDYAVKISSAYENYIKTDSSSLLNGASEITLAAWIYFNSPVSSTAEFIGTGVSSNSAVTSVSLWNYSTYMSLKVYGGVNNFVGTLHWTYGDELTTGVWHRLVATYKKNGAWTTSTASMNIYLDGVLKTNTATAQNGFVLVSDKWRFGTFSVQHSAAFQSVWDGYMDDCIIAPTAWTLGQVTNDFNAGRTLAP